jgi:hypothetical protein
MKRYRSNRILIRYDEAWGHVDMRCPYNHENWRMKCFKTCASARAHC